jgi:Flp pilus assembly protein CpaB
MRGGRILLIVGVIGVVLALIVGGILIIRRLNPPPPPPTEGEVEGTEEPPPMGEMREIVVAAQNIPRGTPITEDNLAVRLALWPEDAIPSDALYELESAYGRIARVDIVLNMPVTEGMLTEDAGKLGATGSDAALLIPSGRVGYAIAVAGNAGVAWAIQPGDHVDVLISLLVTELDEEFQTEMPNNAYCVSPTEEEGCTPGAYGRIEVLPNGWVVNLVPSTGQNPRLITQMTVQNAQVLRVGSWEEEETVEAPPSPEESPEGEAAPAEPVKKAVKWVTLAVTPQEAAVLKYAEETQASIDFVLRSAEDHAANVEFSTTAVTLEYIFARYNIETPPKLPYGINPPVQDLRNGAAGEITSQEGPTGVIEYSRLGSLREEITIIEPPPEE